MRVHQLLALSGLMLMSNVAVGAKLDHDDVPDRCWKVCGPVVGIANKCDGMHHDNDNAEIQCICDWNQAPNLIPLCEACIAEYRSSSSSNNNNNDHRDQDDYDDHDDDNDTDHDNDHNDVHDNDAYDILTSCKLSTTTYNPSAATSALSSTGTSPSTADATATGSGSGSGSSSGSGSGSGSTTSSGSDAQTTDNAASAASVPKAATMAAVMGLGFLAWL